METRILIEIPRFRRLRIGCSQEQRGFILLVLAFWRFGSSRPANLLVAASRHFWKRSDILGAVLSIQLGVCFGVDSSNFGRCISGNLSAFFEYERGEPIWVLLVLLGDFPFVCMTDGVRDVSGGG